MAKILILANNDVGLYKFRKELLEELVKENEVYVSLPSGAFIPKIKELGCKFIETPINRRGTNPIADLKLLINYQKVINSIKPDVVLTYTIKPNVYGGLACRFNNVPFIVNITGLGSSVENGGLLKKITLNLYKVALKKATFVFFQNKENHSLFVENNLVDSEKTKIIPGSGVNTRKFAPAHTNSKSNNMIRFLFIGRIMKEKGIEEYVKAGQSVISKYPNVEFCVLGPFEEDKYKEIINENENNRIKYIGVSSDVREQIKAADCIVNPSYHEGMSNVLLEGGSMEKPLIASDIPGCREIIEEGYNGYVFEVESAESLEEKLIRFIELDKIEKDLMGKRSREKIKAEFDRNKVVDQYKLTISQVLKSKQKYYTTENKYQMDSK
ncbi:glycosyltransferase family 4 protein [Mesobacillus foraminis]|uniref:glycosyltransferase family 4 protein n=1 Tax=Mesobacillus foraminis TaxID=279826 RepID=UPI00399F27C9